VDWRAVEHDRGLPVTCLPSGSDRAAWERELAEVASLAQRGEQVPAGPPVLVSNAQAAVAAYAEAVSDGVADELRRRLFRAIWVQGPHPDSAYEVRRLITAVMRPQEDITDRLASPDLHAAPPGGCWQGQAESLVTSRVSCAIPLLAARRPAATLRA
jgi:hypothetical protein